MDTPLAKMAFILLLAAAATAGCGRRSANVAADSVPNAAQVSQNAQLITLPGSETGAVYADTVNFGRVRTGEIVSLPLRIKNASSEPVVIIDVDKTCGCVDVSYPRHPLKAGEEAAMEVEFDSRGIRGWVYKTAILKTSSPRGEHLLVVTADVE